MHELASRLRERVRGDVRFDKPSRLLYSTDASIYQIEPLGVVIPKEPEDVFEAVEAAREFEVPVLPRGAGTSLAGQTVGRALVIDASMHLNRVLEINTGEHWAMVEPGLVQEDLNRRLQPLGFVFGPDTATANRATLGGMIGNNSAGSHSIVYGKTVDHIEAIDIIVASGTHHTLREVSYHTARNRGGLEGRVAELIDQHREAIVARFPKIMRRVSGYNLDEFVRNDRFNLAKLIAGSEGTLAWVERARVRIEPRPEATALMVVHFRTIAEAVEATEAILPLTPSAVELVDDMILGLARQSLGISRTIDFIEGSPGAILIVEFFGQSRRELDARLDGLEATLKRHRMGYAWPRALDSGLQTRVWNMRKAGLGLLLGMKGERKPVAFVEDCAVEPRKLPDFLKRFRAIVDEFGTRAGYYGHASVGCLHIRPLINLKLPSEVQKMKALMTAVVDLVVEFGGAMSGEHGDGLARSYLNERLFGPEVYQAFRKVKYAFDPDNRMNPGKIVDAPEMDENLRYSTPYVPVEVPTHYDFSREGGIVAASELCSGIGVCRKTADGGMCPSFMVTREETHSTRGRANLMRSVMTGKLPVSELTGHTLYQALDLCLECKACKAECPLGVDMAKLKYEFLAGYNETHPASIRSRLFADVHHLSAAAAVWPRAANWLANAPLVRWAADAWLGIDRRRPLPAVADTTFERWFGKHRRPFSDPDRKPAGKVVLFHDTFMNFNHPEIGRAATDLLEAAGYEVCLANRVCCGRPMMSKGFAKEARENAARNARELGNWIDRGYVVVGCEPSCILTFRDEYPDLIGKQATPLAQSSYLFEEFVERETSLGRWRLDVRQTGRGAILHTHCHQKALVGSDSLIALLGQAYDVTEIDSGCCGMAGAFGYEKEHYPIAMALAERALLPAIEKARNAVIVAPGMSCRQQIASRTDRPVLHPVVALRAAIGGAR